MCRILMITMTIIRMMMLMMTTRAVGLIILLRKFLMNLMRMSVKLMNTLIMTCILRLFPWEEVLNREAASEGIHLRCKKIPINHCLFRACCWTAITWNGNGYSDSTNLCILLFLASHWCRFGPLGRMWRWTNLIHVNHVSCTMRASPWTDR